MSSCASSPVGRTRPPARAVRTRLACFLLALVVLVAVPGPVSARTLVGSTPGAGAGDGSGRYVLPLETGLDAASGASLLTAGLLARDFAPPSVRWGAGHRGVDVLTSPGAVVRAPQSGTVAFVGVVVDRPLVVLAHPDGLRSTLEPVTSGLATGDRVERGDAVGTLAPGAATHCAPSTCLHWGVRQGETYVDPLALVGEPEAVVLLPLRDRRSS